MYALVSEFQFAIAKFNYHWSVPIHFAGNDSLTQFVQHKPLQGALNRTGTELRIITLLGNLVNRIIRHA